MEQRRRGRKKKNVNFNPDQEYLEEAKKEIGEVGGKVINAYALLGRYDFIYITEFPDQKSALKVLFKTAMKGRVSPENLVAIPLEEFLQTVREA